MGAGGECPSCGRVIVDVREQDAKAAPRVPWHFWLLLVALVIYLGFRAYQGVVWLLH